MAHASALRQGYDALVDDNLVLASVDDFCRLTVRHRVKRTLGYPLQSMSRSAPLQSPRIAGLLGPAGVSCSLSEMRADQEAALAHSGGYNNVQQPKAGNRGQLFMSKRLAADEISPSGPDQVRIIDCVFTSGFEVFGT